MRGRKRGVVGLLFAIALASLCAAQLGAADSIVRHASSVTLNSSPIFSGKVSSSPDCLGGRTVKVVNAAGGGVLATTTTAADGSWSKPATFGGTAYARVKRRVSVLTAEDSRENLLVCRKAHSPFVSFGSAPPPRADLGIVKTADPQSQSQQNLTTVAAYHITVSNFGPDAAQNVVVTDTPSDVSRYVQSDPHCPVPASGSTIVCSLGTLAANSSYTFMMSFSYNQSEECITTTDMDTATVAASSPTDPNPSNNSSSAQVPVVCGL